VAGCGWVGHVWAWLGRAGHGKAGTLLELVVVPRIVMARHGTNRFGGVGLGTARSGRARLGLARCHLVGELRIVPAAGESHGEVGHGGERIGTARLCLSEWWHSELVKVRCGGARIGKAGRGGARQGAARPGLAWRGKARALRCNGGGYCESSGSFKAGRGLAGHGKAWQGLFHIQQETLKHEFSDRHDEGKAR
jgi:hypothetical protein